MFKSIAVQNVACEHIAAADGVQRSLASGSDPHDVASSALGDDGGASTIIGAWYIIYVHTSKHVVISHEVNMYVVR